MLYGMYFVLGPLASRRYYGGAAAWAIVSTVAGIGSVLAGLAAVKLRPRHPLTLALAVAALAFLAPLAFAGLLPVPVIAVAAALGAGGIVVFSSLWQTSVQQHVPERILSRASSYDWFCSLLAYPVGLAIAGPLASATGTRLILLAVASLMAVVLAALLLVPSIRNLTAVSAPAVPGGPASAAETPGP
jgi:hypothetical protein